MLGEENAVHEFGALVAPSVPEVVAEMETSSMVQYLVHGMVETALEQLNGAEVLEVQMSQDVFLGQLL